MKTNISSRSSKEERLTSKETVAGSSPAGSAQQLAEETAQGVSAWFPVSKTLPRTGEAVEVYLAYEATPMTGEAKIVDWEYEPFWEFSNGERIPIRRVSKWRRI